MSHTNVDVLALHTTGFISLAFVSPLTITMLDVLLETMAWCHACGEDAAAFVARLQKEFGTPYSLPKTA